MIRFLIALIGVALLSYLLGNALAVHPAGVFAALLLGAAVAELESVRRHRRAGGSR